MLFSRDKVHNDSSMLQVTWSYVMAEVPNGLCITEVPGGPGTHFSHPDHPDAEMLLSGVCTLCRVE